MHKLQKLFIITILSFSYVSVFGGEKLRNAVINKVPIKTYKELYKAHKKDGRDVMRSFRMAAHLGNTEVLSFLISKKINIDATGKSGKPAIFFAIISNRFEAIKLLAENKAKINLPDSQTILNLIVEKDFGKALKIANCLYENGVLPYKDFAKIKTEKDKEIDRKGRIISNYTKEEVKEITRARINMSGIFTSKQFGFAPGFPSTT